MLREQETCFCFSFPPPVLRQVLSYCATSKMMPLFAAAQFVQECPSPSQQRAQVPFSHRVSSCFHFLTHVEGELFLPPPAASPPTPLSLHYFYFHPPKRSSHGTGRQRSVPITSRWSMGPAVLQEKVVPEHTCSVAFLHSSPQHPSHVPSAVVYPI